VAVGGSVNGAYRYRIHSDTPAPTVGAASNIGLYLQGNLQAGGSGATKINSGSNAYIGGTITNGPITNNGGGSTFNSSSYFAPNYFSSAMASLQAQSLLISTLGTQYAGNTVAFKVQPGQNGFDQNNPYGIYKDNGSGGRTLIGNGDGNGLNIDVSLLTAFNTPQGEVAVFNLDPTLFSTPSFVKNPDLRFNNVGNRTVLVNVLGTGTLNWLNKQQDQSLNRILYNFSGITNLTVGDVDEFRGSLLAPFATVNQKKNINGNFIAMNWNEVQSTELHLNINKQFNGWVPNPPQAVPEPATTVVLGAAVAAYLRRRKKA
jgi:hypothetical protein